ncbi:phage integrase SAM-like domain-containing protein [Haloplanus salilacus]|uniref:phage integrase SAM-like domain-containing protein n=1 Tax=Haloplanus salilacus TaxID=2949994 RepID=UPI0030D21B16
MRTEFESFVDYLKARKSKSTWLNRQSGLKKLNEWMDEKDYELEDLDAVTLESFLTWMANGDVSNRTAYEYMTAVRLFFDWYEKRSDFTVNPARNVDTDWIDKDEPKHSGRVKLEDEADEF